VAPDERWVGVDDVAAHLGVGKDSIYRWVENRGLPARKVGRLLRFRLSEVDAWVEAGEGERPAEPPPPAPAPRRGGRRKQKDGGR